MKLIVQTVEMKRALRLARGLAGRVTLPILSCVRLEAEARTGEAPECRLRWTNLDQSLTIPVRADVREGGVVCVPQGKFDAVVASMESGEMELLAADGSVTLKAGRAVTKLCTVDPAEWPEEKAAEPGVEGFGLAAGELVEGLRGSCAQSKDEARYVLNGVHLEVQERRRYWVATDGRRLAVVEQSTGAAMRPVKGTLPRAAVEYLRRFAIGADDSVEVRMGETYAEFIASEVTLRTQLVDGAYPNWRAVVPKEEGEPIVISPDALAAGVRRVGLLTDEDRTGVLVEFGGGMVRLSASLPDVGMAEDESELPGLEIEASFKVGAGLFLAGLAACAEQAGVMDRSVLLFPSDGQAALVLVCGGLKYVLMPMREAQ